MSQRASLGYMLTIGERLLWDLYDLLWRRRWKLGLLCPISPHNAAIRYDASVPPDPGRVFAYTALVHGRKACRACTALVNPAACDGGVYDSGQIGPWSLWQGNLN